MYGDKPAKTDYTGNTVLFQMTARSVTRQHVNMEHKTVVGSVFLDNVPCRH